jgi:predicted transposase/invertase (TIGR01784 family)
MILDIDPKEDYVFKRVMGREATKPILIDVLNQVIGPPPGRLVKDIELRNPFNPGDTAGDKLSILDIKAVDQSGQQSNVEMQMLPHPYYDKRIVYYATRFHQEQLQEGEDYRNLQPTISISFLNHVRFPGKLGYHFRFQILEEKQHFLMTNDLEFHILQLPKFDKKLTGLDMWLYFLRHAEKMDSDNLPEKLRGYPLISQAVEELKMISQSPIERELYEARRKARMDFTSGMYGAKLEGREEGIKLEAISQIHEHEQALHLVETPSEQLLAMTAEELSGFRKKLLDQRLNRGK